MFITILQNRNTSSIFNQISKLQSLSLENFNLELLYVFDNFFTKFWKR
jgi:hypothetical protein